MLSSWLLTILAGPKINSIHANIVAQNNENSIQMQLRWTRKVIKWFISHESPNNQLIESINIHCYATGYESIVFTLGNFISITLEVFPLPIWEVIHLHSCIQDYFLHFVVERFNSYTSVRIWRVKVCCYREIRCSTYGRCGVTIQIHFNCILLYGHNIEILDRMSQNPNQNRQQNIRTRGHL